MQISMVYYDIFLYCKFYIKKNEGRDFLVNLKSIEGKDIETKCKSSVNSKTETAGITLIALVITTIFSYDENVKSSNNKGFLLQTI